MDGRSAGPMLRRAAGGLYGASALEAKLNAAAHRSGARQHVHGQMHAAVFRASETRAKGQQ